MSFNTKIAVPQTFQALHNSSTAQHNNHTYIALHFVFQMQSH